MEHAHTPSGTEAAAEQEQGHVQRNAPMKRGSKAGEAQHIASRCRTDEMR